MLDARCQMLDILECTNGEIQKHPVSRNQHPESANTGNGFRPTGLGWMQDLMQLEGLFKVWV
jgi:hypothetical protein